MANYANARKVDVHLSTLITINGKKQVYGTPEWKQDVLLKRDIDPEAEWGRLESYSPSVNISHHYPGELKVVKGDIEPDYSPVQSWCLVRVTTSSIPEYAIVPEKRVHKVV